MTPNEQVSSWDGDRENRWIARKKLAHGLSFLVCQVNGNKLLEGAIFLLGI
jgi:hypothetical protein